MAGVVPSVLSSRTFAFVLFIVLVWVAVDLGLVIAGVVPGIPAQVRTLIAPAGGATAAQAEQTKL